MYTLIGPGGTVLTDAAPEEIVCFLIDLCRDDHAVRFVDFLWKNHLAHLRARKAGAAVAAGPNQTAPPAALLGGVSAAGGARGTP